MWILPKQLHTSPFVPDTEALISDLAEQSQACAQSLLVRSKVSPARTWSLKWKRDSWTQLLSGRILKPSHGPSFTAAWTSSVAATRASHSAPPASASAPKTQDTSGRLSQPELLQCDQVPVSLKTSRDISALGFPTCCKTWQEWVTERRGAWRARVNAARLTSGSGSLSWPTATMQDGKQGGITPFQAKGGNHTNLLHVAAINEEQKNWPTANARDWKDSITGTHPPSRPRMSEQTLGQAVSVVHGQAAPASSSSHGSRQGLSWPTARSLDGQINESLESWTARRDRKQAEGINLHRPLPIAVMQEQFPTPRTCDWKSSPNADSNIKRMEVGQATLAEFVHAKHKKGDLWSTPRTGATESSRPNNKGGIPLADQAKREQWGTPTARDHKSGRGNENRQYKELTPMVERAQTGKLNPRWVEALMGLPIGWTMPSCTSPQTIAPMSCDSSAMASCLPPQSELSEFSLASWPSPRLNENQQTEELGLLWAENGFKQPKTRGGKARANGSTFDVTLETAARGVAAMEATT